MFKHTWQRLFGVAVVCVAPCGSGVMAQPAPAAIASRPVPERALHDSALTVVEDDQVRIEEWRVRGQLQRVTVVPKSSTSSSPLRPYEIHVGSPGRDPTQDRSAAGQRVWSVLRW